MEKHEIDPYLWSNPCARAKLGPGLFWESRWRWSLGHRLEGNLDPQTEKLVLNKCFVILDTLNGDFLQIAWRMPWQGVLCQLKVESCKWARSNTCVFAPVCRNPVVLLLRGSSGC